MSNYKNVSLLLYRYGNRHGLSDVQNDLYCTCIFLIVIPTWMKTAQATGTVLTQRACGDLSFFLEQKCKQIDVTPETIYCCIRNHLVYIQSATGSTYGTSTIRVNTHSIRESWRSRQYNTISAVSAVGRFADNHDCAASAWFHARKHKLNSSHISL